MKKGISLCLACILLVCTISVPVFARDEIRVYIDGKKQAYDQMPVLVNDRTLVPLRGIFETLGAEVSWDDATQTATGVLGENTVSLTIGSTEATVNGQAVALDVPAQLISDRTMVPVRFISESLGADVEWDEGNEAVIINSKSTYVPSINYNDGRTIEPLADDLPKKSADGVPNVPGAVVKRPVPTEFTKSSALDDLLYFAAPGDPEQVFASLEGGEVFVTTEDFIGAKLIGEGQYATYEAVDVDGPGFTKALRFTTTAVPEKSYSCALELRSDHKYQTDDVGVLVVYTRLLSGGSSDSGTGMVEFTLQEVESGQYTAAFQSTVTCQPEWEANYIPFQATGNFTGKSIRMHIRPGAYEQVVEVGGYQLINFGKKYTVDQMPNSTHYEGMEEDAQWRKDALARIEQIRKGDININVVDANGAAIAGADVKLDMVESEFEWGVAIGPNVLGEGEDADKYRENLVKYFNGAVAETIQKWNYFENDPITAMGITDWCLRNGIKHFRGHCLVWDYTYEPGCSSMPPDLAQYIANGELDKAKERMKTHIFEAAGDFSGKIQEWDVINELTRNDTILTQTFGNEILKDLFAWAREADPNATLYFNECGLSGINSYAYRTFTQFLDWAVANDVDFDAIGVQGHQGMPKDPQIFYDMLTALGERYQKPIKVTEFDIKVNGTKMDPNLEGNFMRDSLISIYSNPYVTGMYCWGFASSGAVLMNRDYTLKPSGLAFEDMVYNKWWTRETGSTDAAGNYATRGYFGDYEVTVTANGKTKTVDARFFKDSDKTLTIVMD